MEVDIRKHEKIRESVWAGIVALKVQARQIWGDRRLKLRDMALECAVFSGNVARAAYGDIELSDLMRQKLKVNLGNILFSAIRWIDDLSFDPLECLYLAIESQEKVVAGKQPP